MWAAYFDAVNLDWIREPDTYELRSISHGQKIYTPDFYVSQWDSFVEVKNQRISWQDFDKMRYLARGVGRAVILLNGRPDGVFAGRVYAPDGFVGGSFATFNDTGDYKFAHTDLVRSPTELARSVQKARVASRDAKIQQPPNDFVAFSAKLQKDELFESRRILS